MIALSGIHHIGIVVTDLEASTRWYADKLGFEHLFSFGWPGVQVAFIGRGDLKLELFQNAEASPMAEERCSANTNLKIGGINHLAITVANLDATVAALQANGVAVVSAPREVPNSGGSRFAFIQDNEKMLIELVQPA